MKLGLLETGAPPPGPRERFGGYPDMFRRLFGEEAYDYATYRVVDGVLPGRPEDCDAYVITGSSAGVYDDLPWIPRLKDFLAASKGRAGLVGVCFGHQVMAEAFGGKVVKSPKGWGVGLHRYRVSEARPWMDGAQTIAVAASHQDQVAEPPPGTRVLAGNAFSPFGMLAYEDQPAISIQLHPEFEPAYARALIKARRGTRYSPLQADQAILSYEAPDDRARVGDWIKAFLAGV